MTITRFAILAGFMVLVASPAALRAQMDHGHHPAFAQQRYALKVQFTENSVQKVIRAPIELKDATAAETLDQVVALPAPLPPLHVRAFLPSATLEQSVVPDPTGKAPAATLVSIEGPRQSIARWMVADDPQRNRLTSLIGTWRFMTVTDEQQHAQLYYDFQTEYSRSPRLQVAASADSTPTTITAEPGTIHDLPALGGRVRILDFYPHYALSKESGQPVNVSAKRVNPALHVELERYGVKEKRWVFAQFPDYRTGEPEVIPWRLTLDCPAEGKSPRPDVAIVLTRPDLWETWLRFADTTTAQAAEADQLVDLPGSQYAFRLRRMIPSGRLVERYKPTNAKNGVQAVRVDTMDAQGRDVTAWLIPQKPYIVPGKIGPITLTLEIGLESGGSHP